MNTNYSPASLLLAGLQTLGQVCPSPSFEQTAFEDRHGVTGERLYTFVDFSDNASIEVLTAPAADPLDFAKRYYSQIVKF